MRSPNTPRLKRWSTLAATCYLLRSLYALPAIAQEEIPLCDQSVLDSSDMNFICQLDESTGYRVNVGRGQPILLEDIDPSQRVPADRFLIRTRATVCFTEDCTQSRSVTHERVVPHE
ncbi:hypothetical protein [Sphaerothrix gracilis]|uniref:hypothetical protein n=1 Tax=Sphaerothrix gracilis TaxID=3151835 RepID=UPI0031FDF96D